MERKCHGKSQPHTHDEKKVPKKRTPFISYSSRSPSHSQGVDDHDDTPDDRPDPADEGQDELQDADDDVRKAAVKSTSDDGADAKEEAVEDAADECDHATPGSLESGGVQNDVTAKAHGCCSLW